jgi:hypothetical protein
MIPSLASVRSWLLQVVLVGLAVALTRFSPGIFYVVLVQLLLMVVGLCVLAVLRRLRPAAGRGDLARRWFTLLDAAVLIAATAVGLGSYRVIEVAKEPWALFDSRGSQPVWGWKGAVWDIRADSERVLPFLMPWTIAVLALRFLCPRPRLRRLLRQPGSRPMSPRHWLSECFPFGS